ncbi:MAG: DUF3383 domain-containing protein [Oscillospiraceae bacterium]|jgi:hypothetical protein|nr:DUF3383 domain-containing protein [Oscillospiraceae bacterium]
MTFNQPLFHITSPNAKTFARQSIIPRGRGKAVRTRFLAPGVWQQETFQSVSQGDALSKGYKVLSDSIDSQTTAERASRAAPAIYVLVKLAGAIEFVIIKVVVDR